MTSDEFNRREDKQPAREGQPQIAASGEKFWVLRVALYQPAWMADCVSSLLIWESPDEVWHTDTGRYWPATDFDDGA